MNKFRYVYSNGREIRCFIYTLEEIENNSVLNDMLPLGMEWKRISRDMFTGIKDKNGDEICKCDIVTHEDFKCPSEVTFEKGCFRIHDFTIANFEAIHMMDRIEIISNTHIEALEK